MSFILFQNLTVYWMYHVYLYFYENIQSFTHLTNKTSVLTYRDISDKCNNLNIYFYMFILTDCYVVEFNQRYNLSFLGLELVLKICLRTIYELNYQNQIWMFDLNTLCYKLGVSSVIRERLNKNPYTARMCSM